LKVDFNLLFWKVFGVNQRVHEPLDIFKVERDKQADEKDYSNFIKSDHLLSNKNYVQQLGRETEIFYIFFINYLLGNSQLTQFYIHQLNNITYNYKIFNEINIEKEKYINMFAFQIALIIEKMYFNNIDISLFNESLEENSINPFLCRCKLKTKSKTKKALSCVFSYMNEQMSEHYLKNKIKLEEISPSTFEKDLSQWEKGKSLPSFIKLLVIINTIEKGNSPEKIGIFMQLLLIRALLHIKKEFKLDDCIKNKFYTQLKNFRSTIKKSNLTINEDIINQQEKYVINFPSSENIDQDSINDTLKLLHFRMNIFFESNYPNEKVNIILPNREMIIEKFSKCKTNNDYLALLNSINNVSSDILYNQNINGANNLVRFIIAVKIEDKILFNQKYKCLDRSFGTLLSLGGLKKKLITFSEILKDKNDLIECINLISEHIKKLSTLE